MADGKKVLVIGGGAREHALLHALSKSPSVAELACAPGNGGTGALGQNMAVDVSDAADIVRVARSFGADLVVVGPEAPLVDGAVDALEAAGIAAFGPNRAAAELEASKVFSKHFMKEFGIPTADFRVFSDPEEAILYVREQDRPLVVKADGLAAGKGVVVADDADGAMAAVNRIMCERAFGDAGAEVVIEERLCGQEVSYHVVCDGERYVALAAAQDHKRLLDGDRGPNTGGMGAYSPPPVVTAEVEKKILERIVEPTLAGMRERGAPFRGALFCGLMIVDGEPYTIEYNVRFGDPETEVLMARWSGDILPLLWGSATGNLRDVESDWQTPAALCVVMAADGYPGSYAKGNVIKGLPDENAEVVVFHAGTVASSDGPVTSGGRVLCVTGKGADVDDAAAAAYGAVSRIEFEGAQFRRDIGFHARSR